MTRKVLGIIPARFGSTRLPGKALRTILGTPMIQRVYERCRECDALDELWVATDDERIAEVVTNFGGQACMTSPDHLSGTDRLAEAVLSLEGDIVINIQGDQPFIDPEMIQEVSRPMFADASLEMATLMVPIRREEDLHDPGVVKAVTDRRGNALYFSRSLIPFPQKATGQRVFEHVGLYAYRRDFLLTLAGLPPTPLELTESLEQLRVLEHGYRLRVVESSCQNQDFHGFSVDTEADLIRAEKMLEERQHVENGS